MTTTRTAVRRTLWAMAATIIIAVGGATLWSVAVPLDGALIAAGTVAVEGNVKKVQHTTGGIIAKINVVEGQQVTAGDVLVQLNDTSTRAILAIVSNELTALRGRLSRLHAERDAAKAMSLPGDLEAAAASNPETAKIIEGERSLFKARTAVRDGQKQQLGERVKQLHEEIAGLEAQMSAALGQLTISRGDFDAIASMDALVVRRPRRSELEREVYRMEAMVGELRSKIAQGHGKIAETDLQISQLDRDRATEVAKDIREAETKIAELAEKRTAAEDQLMRVDVRAPVHGIVHGLAVHTINGVISPGEAIMTIVPTGQSLIVEARLAPTDRHQLYAGQRTRIRFPGLNQITTPEITGTVFRVPESATVEPQTGASYYLIGIRMTDADLTALGSIRLVPGMPAEALIATGERTFASYLLKPLRDQMERALREAK